MCNLWSLLGLVQLQLHGNTKFLQQKFGKVQVMPKHVEGDEACVQTSRHSKVLSVDPRREVVWFVYTVYKLFKNMLFSPIQNPPCCFPSPHTLS